MKKYRKDKQLGMTLIEIMVVVVIIGILGTIGTVAVMNRLAKARGDAAKAQMKNIETALDSFKVDNGFYPSSDQGLKALINKPTEGREVKNYLPGGYIKGKKAPVDPWGKEFHYSSPGQEEGNPYEIVSDGPDGQEGTEDDIKSWDLD